MNQTLKQSMWLGMKYNYPPRDFSGNNGEVNNIITVSNLSFISDKFGIRSSCLILHIRYFKFVV